jgi:phenylalanyl-tRNA synthetase beta chain
MRISFNWLKEHVELPLAAADLPRHLLQLGFEVSELTQLGAAFSGVVVAKVVSKDKHPNADKLSVCVVDDGAKKWNVVCGAPNVAAGQTVAFARLGAELPGGFKIGKAKLRGVDSEGMICSAKELGLGGDHSGIMVLPDTEKLGAEYGAELPRDTVLEVEITPNRPDCLSHRGLARELAAYFRLSLKPLQDKAIAGSGDSLPIEIIDPKLCPRYQGRLFTGVKVGPSPAWLKARLESVGQRSINNVVDATNFVLLDLGQPLHVFDADKLEGGIVVRRAKAGETLKALDGQTYTLGESHLVIADKKKPLAIAGVMGGADSAVSEKTTRVFLESAHFAPSAARRSSQSLRLRSDSSYRFERGTDPEAVPAGALRAAGIIGGKASNILDVYPAPKHRLDISYSPERINQILGSKFPDDSIQAALSSIAKTTSGSRLTPPSWRWDLETVWDLAEEVGRMLGYGNIPSTVPSGSLRPSRSLPSVQLTQRAAQKLAGLGFSEAYNYDIVSEALLQKAGLSGTAFIDNPISAEWAVMRPALLPGLLQNAALNVNRGAQAVRLFELGKGYERSGDAVHESLRLAGVMLGPSASTRWRGERRGTDFFDVKGAVEEVLAGAPGLVWTQGAISPVFHPKDALSAGKTVSLGRLHPERAAAYKLERQEVLVFEIVLDDLLAAAPSKKVFTPYSQFPGVVRDLSLVNEKSASFAALEEAVRKNAGTDLKAVELIDVFDEKKSLTVRLQFGRDDRTLRDAEVNEAAAKAVAALAKLGAVLRS